MVRLLWLYDETEEERNSIAEQLASFGAHATLVPTIADVLLVAHTTVFDVILLDSHLCEGLALAAIDLQRETGQMPRNATTPICIEDAMRRSDGLSRGGSAGRVDHRQVHLA